MNKLEQVKLKIYENCHKGEITEAERDVLLEAAEEKFAEVDDTTVTESTEGDEEAEFTESVMTSVINGEMTEEEAADLIMGYAEMMESSIENEDLEGEETLEKASITNDDLSSEFKEANKRYKHRLMLAKDQMKRGDKGDAADELDKAKKELLECKDLVKRTKVSTGQNALGLIGGTVTSWGTGTLLGIATGTLLGACGVVNPGAIGTKISKSYQISSALGDAVSGLKRSEGEVSTDVFNRTKTQIIRKIDCEIANINRLIASLN